MSDSEAFNTPVKFEVISEMKEKMRDRRNKDVRLSDRLDEDDGAKGNVERGGT